MEMFKFWQKELEGGYLHALSRRKCVCVCVGGEGGGARKGGAISDTKY